MRDRFLRAMFAALCLVFAVVTLKDGFNVTLLVSLLAVYVAMYGLRTNTTTMMSVIHCWTVQMTTPQENSGKPFYIFKIAIRNEGVTIINPILGILYYAGQKALTSAALSSPPPKGDPHRLERGMVFEVEMKSYQHWARLNELTDPRKQKARLEIRSQNYIAYTFPIGGWRDRLGQVWNWIRRKSRLRKLPEAVVIEDGLMRYAQNCHQ